MSEADPFKAFDFAREVVTQLIALSTGTIALTITFLKDFLGSSSRRVRRLAMISWGAFFVSLMSGMWSLLALTGNLEPVGGPPILSIRGSNVVLPAALQVLTFLLGTFLTIIYAAVGFLEVSDDAVNKAKAPLVVGEIQTTAAKSNDKSDGDGVEAAPGPGEPVSWQAADTRPEHAKDDPPALSRTERGGKS